MACEWLVFVVLWTVTNAVDIELLECDPPDLPRWGGYAPRQDFYLPGDVVHYYCDVDTFIGANYYRRCEDTGDWTGETPLCDAPTTFSSTTQSSTADELSGSEKATDGQRTSCTSTQGGEKQEWSGIFTKPGELIRVMLFLPLGPASFEIVLVKPNGNEIVCGSHTTNIDRYEWRIQNCGGPHNLGVTGLKIRSLTTAPLQICEIQAHVLVSPKCVDPHFRVESGRLRIDRHSAVLVCDAGYTRSPDTKLNCIRDGVWNRKTLYCLERQWVSGEKEPASDDGGERPDWEPREEDPDKERLSSVRKRPNSEPRRKNPERERL